MRKCFLFLAIFFSLSLNELYAQFYVKTGIGINASQQYLHVGNKSYNQNGVLYSSHYEKDLMLGFSVGRQIKNYLGLEVKVNYLRGGNSTFLSQAEDGNTMVSQNANSLQSFVNLVYSPLGTKKLIRPYLIMGMGVSIFSDIKRSDEMNFKYGDLRSLQRVTVFKTTPALRANSGMGVVFRLHKHFSAYTEVTAIFMNRQNFKEGKVASNTENGIPTEPFIIECSSCDFHNINFEKEAGSKVSKYSLDNGIGLSVGVQFNF